MDVIWQSSASEENKCVGGGGGATRHIPVPAWTVIDDLFYEDRESFICIAKEMIYT